MIPGTTRFARYALLLPIAASGPSTSHDPPGGVIHTIEVPAPSLRGNLLGDSARRTVSVYLPPQYASELSRRFPVIYLLHGFAADHKAFIAGAYQDLNVRISMDSLIAAGKTQPMIVVTPNARNRFDGSFYANSPVTGKWEDFVTKDLVGHIDRRYRTLARPSARGIAGHSMGGYGALNVGMRNPHVFSAIYALSACCLSAARSDLSAPGRNETWKKILSVTDTSRIREAGFHANIQMALAAVYSPAPDQPPLYVAYPFFMRNDSLLTDSAVAARWTPPITQVERYKGNLARMRIGFDAGRSDGLTDIPINARALHEMLTGFGIEHFFEIYEGNHGNRIRERLERVVFPYFSAALR
ncbi:MAG TPA: alpha/beta hydrolase-fold protein [Gemmatimonadaceae bacterium]|nr:alpha/beta hydrolase-fold protein [Gemmatimonadaceae bacterium]